MERPTIPPNGVRWGFTSEHAKSFLDYSEFAAGPGMYFRTDDDNTSGLNFALFGGRVLNGATVVEVADWSDLMPASQAHIYVEIANDGTISYNTTAFTLGRQPLYHLVTNENFITQIDPKRCSGRGP